MFAMFGAEGLGSDLTVFAHVCDKGLKWLQRTFLIGDAGYTCTSRVLTPYRGVRYHLKEYHPTAGGRPQNKEELFNFRHACFRNQIERKTFFLITYKWILVLLFLNKCSLYRKRQGIDKNQRFY
jgi:hypothetical protein